MFPFMDLSLSVIPIDRELRASQTEKYRGILATLDGPLLPDPDNPDDLSIPPEPFDCRPVMKITEYACDHMVHYLGSRKPELAGALLGPKGGDTVTRFVADEWGEGTGGSFTFGSAELNRAVRPLIAKGEEIVGIAHSHPNGFSMPSGGDWHYFQGLFANPKNTDLEHFWCPIFESGLLHVFQAKRIDAERLIQIVSARLEVTP